MVGGRGEGKEWGWHLELAVILVSLAVARNGPTGKDRNFMRQFGGDIL